MAKQSFGWPGGIHSDSIPITCIGLSAGGLQPLKTIFEYLSPHTGMAFVVVSHVSRTEPTSLPNLLSRWSRMPSELARCGMILEANHIYIIPPGQEILLDDGQLRVQPRSKQRGWSNVLTLFLDSMVNSPRMSADVAVILSGLGADGAAALEGFHARGGIAIAQDPDSAEYEDMPRAAIATGFVSSVLPPEDIAGKIEEIAKSSATESRPQPHSPRHPVPREAHRSPAPAKMA
ncbi:MAG TPA: chemotaxis protein CheB [Bryobacteraceae bacterium]|nr:chemotaxis protein CheB [Bryobacteraceae bacterium]